MTKIFKKLLSVSHFLDIGIGNFLSTKSFFVFCFLFALHVDNIS